VGMTRNITYETASILKNKNPPIVKESVQKVKELKKTNPPLIPLDKGESSICKGRFLG